MKKILIIAVIIVVTAIFIFNKKEKVVEENKFLEDRGVFISYLEFNSHLRGKSDTEQKVKIIEMINNLKEKKFNLILLQVRPFSDAIYNSKIFPISATISGKEGKELSYDLLSYFIDIAHRNKMKVHAWINPYRVRSDNDIKSISKLNPAYKWINDGSNNIQIKNGIYYNPASNDVLNLIINGVKELVSNYDIDGVLYDDYFYPNKTIDLENYKIYQKEGGKLSLSEYRYQNINNLIKETYLAVKRINKNVLFGISPAGNIENNKNNLYLDLEYLLQSPYLDYVMPQIYFGFDNSNKPYIKTVNEWKKLIKNSNIKFYVALAPYKIGKVDKYAGTGKNEWINSSDILKRQIEYLRTIEASFSLFRYDYIFERSKYQKNTEIELSNMYSIFNY